MIVAKRFDSPETFLEYAKEIRRKRDKCIMEIRVCAGPGCLGRGARDIYTAIHGELQKRKSELKNKNLEVGVELVSKSTGCHGLCEAGPLVTFEPSKLFYSRVTPANVAEIVEKSVLNNETIERLLFTTSHSNGSKQAHHYTDIPFYALQRKVALRNVGAIDPLSFEDFIAAGGFTGFIRAITEMTPEQVVSEVSTSGLRGRGGAGFLTGKKWELARRATNGNNPKYLVCNGDEGDPGAFMDRAVMEGDPYSVMEGLLIGAYAIGATDGYLYVRHEYPIAVRHLQAAIETLERVGLMGENILGTGLNFCVKLSRGGGAFVCGEETALMASIEGKTGEPRQKPPYPVEKGLWGYSTCINNVETLCNVPEIINKGASEYSKIGVPGNSGTKVFSLVGKIKNTGLVEVPMGITLRQIIYEIGGGIIDDHPFKAIQTGGPSGGCLPTEKLDLQVDYDTLTEAGAMMGSGGMIVMDDRTCMVDIADYFIRFLIGESCGQCVPCREGLHQVHILLQRIIQGRGEMEDLSKIEEICSTMKTLSLCQLGKTAPNPITSTLKYFRDEYIAHVREKKCPAGVCKALIRYEINKNCRGCQVCKKQCPAEAISGEKNQPHVIDQDKCITCGICHQVCPPKFDAVDIISCGEIVGR